MIGRGWTAGGFRMTGFEVYDAAGPERVDHWVHHCDRCGAGWTHFHVCPEMPQPDCARCGHSLLTHFDEVDVTGCNVPDCPCADFDKRP